MEIIHESLLANWPRLVRWQTQDVEGAQLRDELRQAARTWHEHDRSDDMLWTGSAYREFALWRERYPGGLSDLEEAFAAAMTSLATRRRRRRRIAVTAVIIVLLAGLAVVGTFWRRSVEETRRAEAAKLLAIAQVQIETDPTEAMAYATASLELADAYEARVFATRALWAGPPVHALDIRRSVEGSFWVPTFSPDGRWLAVAPLNNENVVVYGERGGDPIVLGGHPASPTAPVTCQWSRDGFLATSHPTEDRVRIWSVPEGRLIRTIDFGGPNFWQVGENHLLAEIGPGVWGQPGPTRLMRWELPDGAGEDLGSVDFSDIGVTNSVFDPGGEAWLYAKGDDAYSRPLPVEDGAPDRMFFGPSSGGVWFGRWRRPVGVITYSSDGTRLWTAAEVTSAPSRRLPWMETATTPLAPDSTGRWFVEVNPQPAGQLGLWDLTGPPEARPRALKRSGLWHFAAADFHPTGDWVVVNTHDMSEISFWPLSTRLPDVIDGGWVFFGFTPDGRYVIAFNPEADEDGTHHTRLWPVPGTGSPEIPDLRLPSKVNGMKVDAKNEYAVTSWYGGGHLIPLNGEEHRLLEGFPGGHLIFTAFSPSGKKVAGATGYTTEQPAIRVWDLHTGEVEQVFDQPTDPEAAQGDGYATSLAFTDEDTLFTCGSNGLLRWDLETGAFERILRAPPGTSLRMSMASDARKMLVYQSRVEQKTDEETVTLFDPATGEAWELEIPAGRGTLQLSPDGTLWVSFEEDGTIKVGRIEGGDPYLFFGHDGPRMFATAISPDNRWVASSGTDKTLRLWPMPDLSKPPLYTLPHAELIARLHSLTNIRVVRDEASPSGWKIEVGPFPGWTEVPEW